MRRIPSAVLMALLAAGLWSGAARAASGAACDYCREHPEACAAAGERLKQRCAADPAACERVHERVDDLKARCAANPDACEARKQELRERAETLRDRCEANPEACEQQKQKLRERIKERLDQRPPSTPH